MGKLVVTEFVSVDGVFEDPGGSEEFEHGGWRLSGCEGRCKVVSDIDGVKQGSNLE